MSTKGVVNMADTIGITEAAKLLGVPNSTLQMWWDVGLFEGEKTPAGTRRLNRESVLAMQRDISTAQKLIKQNGPSVANKRIDAAFARWRISGNIVQLCRDILGVQRGLQNVKSKQQGAA